MTAPALAEIPAVSPVLAGGALTCMPLEKTVSAGVSEAPLAEHGTVDSETAEQIGEGIRRNLSAGCPAALTGTTGSDAPEDLRDRVNNPSQVLTDYGRGLQKASEAVS